MAEDSLETRTFRWIWEGYGLNIPFSKADSCIHTKEGHPDKKCYEGVMTRHVFCLIKDDVCEECSLYQKVGSTYWKKIKEKLKWKTGEELEAEVKGDKLVIEKD